jgi:hypothetical protein
MSRGGGGPGRPSAGSDVNMELAQQLADVKLRYEGAWRQKERPAAQSLVGLPCRAPVLTITS